MRIRTHGVATAAALALMSACASAPAASSTTTAATAELSALRTQQVDQTRRIAELETRLSLLEADARRTRDGAEPLRSGESVHIGDNPSQLTTEVGSRGVYGASPATGVVTKHQVAATGTDEDALDDGKRPSLRLYGSGTGTTGAKPRASLPAVPEVNERLPVVPLPEQRAAKALRSSAAAAPEAGIDAYRKGLRALKERRYDDALGLFATFASDNPRHELVSSALYWRGEALYAKREYSAASKEFQALLERFPDAQRAPDALLKLGLSFKKLGAVDQADDAFQRLRTDYPNSQAAQAAAREGST